MLNIGTYIQANEQINGENGALGEIDVANRPLKELVSLFNNGNADTQVRRINFKIDGAQQIADGVISDDVVWFNNTTGKYELATWDSTQAMGFIDVENLQIYSFGEYTLKNINDLIPGHAYSISKLNAGKIVSNTDGINSSYSHMGVARANNKIEINKFVDSVFDSVTINDVSSSLGTVYSSSKTETEITNRATKIYYFTNTSNNISLAPNPTKLYNLPLNSTIMDLTSNQIYTKKSNNGITIDSALSVGLSSGAVTKLKLDWTNLVGTPSFATVSTSGSYADLSNKPVNVTTTVDGFMSKDDKSKLNGINPEVSSVVSSVVRRGTDGSIIAGGTSNFGNINAGTVTAGLVGNASTATKLSTDRTTWSTNGTLSSTVGQLAWNNYGNNHTIFDASKGLTPTGVSKSNTTPDFAWSATYPTLMGYNGVSTFGVRVDISARSESCTGTAQNANQLIGKNWNWSGQGGQPTWLWGGSDGTNMYVYNPSNFNVNYSNISGVANNAIGYNQNWGYYGRANYVWYTNDTGRPIMVSIASIGRDAYCKLWVNGVEVAHTQDTYQVDASRASANTIVPPGATYMGLTGKYNGGDGRVYWAELR